MFEALIRYLADLKKSGPLQDWEVPYFIKRFYDDLFGISDKCYVESVNGGVTLKKFDEHNSPLRMVSKTSREGMLESALYLKRFQEFRTYEIYSITGMSFTEWLKLPPHLLETFLNELRVERAELNAIKAKANAKINSETGTSAEERAMLELARQSKAFK